ncbi:50S ribosomal protein L35 [Mycoplasmopsis anatis]|uniref:Large ribosomal subunit protein bL35 n=1 Tax=Mycoplasmopsis anatis 1340 TaxID=1034808 RepID=F9QCT3_9BACT|nr:50S ribosomal protein L35 [Mycoplasmopsis anatis]AWX69851.1 50S ribosomal protein L35 [Mycoplasmopsis anatis]EGS29451.1 50S ribosomal protein L35 [Mycoplasmopsis anatis 1340]VEU73727.1 50S ribosomal protein L35 [Mycoplasmopsis anatis]
MPKMKSKSALKKRIKITGTGKVLREQAFRSHLAQNKTTKQKRHARKSKLMSRSDIKRFKALF